MELKVATPKQQVASATSSNGDAVVSEQWPPSSSNERVKVGEQRHDAATSSGIRHGGRRLPPREHPHHQHRASKRRATEP
ncbi:hypothetical protein Dimus_033188 [Dionaea muscipula]